jgi:ABC-2 type transport system ATP-binding protein
VTVRVLGLDPARQADRLRPQIGSQLQDSALPDRLRVGEAIALFANDRARDAEPLLAQFGLTHLRRSAFAGLSGGEQQRLFLVLALLNRPRLVILDELTQGLDPAARRDVWSAIAQLRDSGTTVLLVTHEMGEAEVLCDRVVVMRAGRVLDAGTPHEVVARHAGGATVRFSWPAVERAAMMSDLRSLPGVRNVSDTGRALSVQGDRQVIAHVGAALVSRGQIPADLTVEIPNLETAMLGLLSHEPAPALIGASR